ncbi:MAG: M16 family metallopeptidase [Opitutales bacterium]
MSHSRSVSRPVGESRAAWLLAARLLALALVFAFWLAPRVEAEPVVWPHQVSDLEPDPAVLWGQLDNGMRYAILPNPEPPDRISLRLLVEAGSLQEPDGMEGIAHFLEHMAFNGTERFPEDEQIEYLQRLGMSFGADTNASTGFDRTLYMLELPNTEEGVVTDALKLLRDYADGMTLAPEAIEQERGVILSEKRARDSIAFRTAMAEYAFLFPNALIPERFPIGTEEAIRSVDQADFQAFYNTFYRPETMALIVVGSVDPQAFEARIQEHFGSMTAGEATIEAPDPGRFTFGDEDTPLKVKVHPEAEEPAVRVALEMTLPLPESRQVDTLDRRIHRLYRSAATSIINRRMEERSKDADAPFQTGTIGIFPFLNKATIASLDLTSEPDQWEASLAEAEQTLRRALEFGFTQAEVDEVRANLINGLETTAAGADTRRNGSLANAMAEGLNDDQVFSHPEQALRLLKPALEAMTPDDVLAAFRSAWQGPTLGLFATGPFEDAGAVQVAMTEALEASRQIPVEPPEAAELIDFAYTDFGESSGVAQRRPVEDLDIHQITFENGVRLNVKQTDFQLNEVVVAVRFGNGLLDLPADQPALARLADSVFTEGGLEAHDVDTLRRILAGRTVGSSFSTEQGHFQLAGTTTPDDLELQLQLLAAYLMEPGYREEARTVLLRQLDPLYRQLKQTQGGVLQDQVFRFLAGGDPRFGYPEKAALESLTMDDLEAWLDPILEGSPLEVSIVGDVEPETAIELVNQTFGALAKRPAWRPAPDTDQLAFPRQAEDQVFAVASRLDKGLAMVAWPTTDQYSDIRLTRRLSVLGEVFTDRLRVQVREDLGEAYSPYAGNNPSRAFPDFGYFFTYIPAAPDKLETIADIAQSIGQELATEGMTVDEVERALKPVLASLPETRRTNSYWLNSVLSGSTFRPEQLDWARSILDDYAAIQRGELEALARIYLPADRSVRIQVLPEGETGAEAGD